MLIALLWGLTLGGTVWIAAQAAAVHRQRRILHRVRAICNSADVRKSGGVSFQERWAAAGGEGLRAGWATDRVRELIRLRAGGWEAAGALCRLDERKARRSLTLMRVMAGGVLLLGLAGTLLSLCRLAPGAALTVLSPLTVPLTVLLFSGAGLLGFLWLCVLSTAHGLQQQAFLGELERLTLLDLGPLLLVTDEAVAAERFADRLEQGSRRLEAVVEALPDCLERFAGGMQTSLTAFAPRLDHAAQNLLQSVESMRQAGSDLREGTSRFEESYAGIATVYARMEQLAGEVARSQAGQQERLSEIAAGLHGITESLTTVVASANASQEAVSRTSCAMTGATSGMESGISRLQASIERLAARITAEAVSSPSSEGVTLRRLAEQQQQFINLLDHRLGRMDRRPVERR